MQGQCYASNSNQNYILGPKQAEGNHLNWNDRSSCQTMWEGCIFFQIKFDRFFWKKKDS